LPSFSCACLSSSRRCSQLQDNELNKNQEERQQDSRLLPKDNDNRTQDCHLRTITSCHPSKIAAKYQQKSYEYYLRDNHVQEVDVTRSTHDRKRIWKEMCQRNTNWSSEEGNLNTNKSKKVLEANETDTQNDGVLMKLWGNSQLQIWRNLSKKSVFSLSVVRSRGCNNLENVACPG